MVGSSFIVDEIWSDLVYPEGGKGGFILGGLDFLIGGPHCAALCSLMHFPFTRFISDQSNFGPTPVVVNL